MISWSQPHFFALILFVIGLVVFWILTEKFRPKFRHPLIDAFQHSQKSTSTRSPLQKLLSYLRNIFRILALCSLILAIVRPQLIDKGREDEKEGVDMMLCVDTSGSMIGHDFVVNGKRVSRLDALKEVLAKFVSERPSDRFGMVVFGTYAFLQIPLTNDAQLLQSAIEGLKVGMAEDATAIGDALMVGIKRIKDLPLKDKIIILLTDGENTAGNIDPRTAAETAKQFGVRIYTIAMGRQNNVPVPVDTPFGTQWQSYEFKVDFNLLNQISTTTNGKFFKAEDVQSLEKIYSDIDQLEKSQFKTTDTTQYQDIFSYFLIIAMLCLLLEIIFWQLPPSRTF